MNWYIKRRISDCLEKIPWLYVKIQKFKFRKEKNKFNRVISRSSIFMIEGYPRSANSFTLRAFRKNNDPKIQYHTAMHLHSPAHVIESIRLKIPCLVLIRELDNAIISRIALLIQAKELGEIDYKNMSNKDYEKITMYWTKRYYNFYNPLIKFSNKIVIAHFNQVISNFDAIIEKVNNFFNTSFKKFNHSQEHVNDIFYRIGVNVSPNKEREIIKDKLKEIYFSKKNNQNRLNALSSYKSIIKNYKIM